MIEIPFTKMHGLGNCFILMDDRENEVSGSINPNELAKSICNRDFGIGADGLILVCRPEDVRDIPDTPNIRATHASPLRMRIFNEDGSEPEMCGNGVRCFARYVVNEGIVPKDILSSRTRHASPLRIETLAGVISTRLLDDGQVEVDMGEPTLNNDDVKANGEGPITVNENGFVFTFVSMGNPHAVTFVDDFDFNWRKIGAAVEQASSFPSKTNVEFVRIRGRKEVDVKVWERGCGETMACGTGACAVTVAGALLDLFPREPIAVHLPGGTLEVFWNAENHVMMTGPTVRVCKGVYWF
ncbi:MAG: diaminopimelate epimerase [Deltaproteobacteria bacterium]|nr:diaminopimelate epimerase [Deltaproteobacteria bacterium]